MCEKTHPVTGQPERNTQTYSFFVVSETLPEGEVYVPAVDRRKSSRTPGTGRSGREEWT